MCAKRRCRGASAALKLRTGSFCVDLKISCEEEEEEGKQTCWRRNEGGDRTHRFTPFIHSAAVQSAVNAGVCLTSAEEVTADRRTGNRRMEVTLCEDEAGLAVNLEHLLDGVDVRRRPQVQAQVVLVGCSHDLLRETEERFIFNV